MTLNFTDLDIGQIPVQVDKFIKQNLQKIDQLASQQEPNWNNFCASLETVNIELNNYWAIVEHLNSVNNSHELRESYNQCLSKLSQYSTELGQNQKLYQASQKVANSKQFAQLNQAQKQAINNSLRDFRLSGIDLSENKQKRFKQINLKLSSLASKFSENILDTTNAWQKNIIDKTILSGVPKDTLDLAQDLANKNNQSGYTLTLDFPCYYAVITYADNRQLRQEFYQAYTTRAATTGEHDPKYDNSKIMLEILELKQEKANILGFGCYAELSLVTKMVDNPQEVESFLENLINRSYQQAKQEFAEVVEFSGLDNHKLTTIEPWDLAYYSERYKQKLFKFDSNELKPWFPVDKVLSGLFKITEILFSVKIVEIKAENTWHKAVRLFEVKSADGNTKAYFYLDLYARKNKRGGAWMDVCREQVKLNEVEQLPIAYLNCNFTPQIDGKPSLLTHDELTTLFHEFGHGWHHMLSEINIPSVGGINGVAWDAVELPSQFMENFCWQPEVMPMISEHYQTKQPLPETKLQALIKAKNFNSALAMVRQLEFALFDFKLHSQSILDSNIVEATLAKVREKTAILKAPEWARFANSFSHIFAGGYAAGYYSYKWAEVLSADAFALFETEKVLSKTAGKKFLRNILQKGGSEDFINLFVAFRGRKPKIDALLRHSGVGIK